MKVSKLTRIEQKRLDKFLKEVSLAYNFSFVNCILQNQTWCVYIFGGAIRNTLLGLPVRDIDILVLLADKNQKRREERLLSLIRPFVQVQTAFRFSKNETTFRVIPKNSAKKVMIDINVSGSLKFIRLDFTMNELYLDLRSKYLIDRYGGLADLRRRKIRTVIRPEYQFKLEPHTLFRIMKIASRGDFKVDATLLKAMRRAKSRIRIPLEHIVHYRNDWLSEIHLGSLFLGLRYNPKVWWGVFFKSGLFEVFLDFVNKKIGFGTSLLRGDGESMLEELSATNSLEKRISIFLSQVARQIFKERAHLGFLKLQNLLGLNVPKKFGELQVNVKRIKFVN